ncbi:hypothetical protein CCR85_14625 [Rhodothalassium salexigens]|uniref:MerR family transcriptional regulator n=1 Tax=Rhodothalassium salexigens TaxID=1086 RepID=UPI00191171A5|nr:MerR family DNA-binding transcriptional regulator [Rhodothalassium salexigens]MBK5912715.1 hypothetical protein [Rhodothalassium salexigens]MBK5920628.1 hypothetical protein [Rhodothalassium salexigens]
MSDTTRRARSGAADATDRTPAGRARTYSIADLAAAFGVTHRTIRYYEDHGLLSPRREGQVRVYSATDRARLSWILRGKRVGFSLAEIAELLDLYSYDRDRTAQRRRTLEKCRERIAALTRQRDDIDKTLGELTAFCALVDSVLADPSVEAEARARFQAAVGGGIVVRPCDDATAATASPSQDPPVQAPEPVSGSSAEADPPPDLER